MENEPKQNLPYEENEESFGKWFREAAKEKWQNYLNGNERVIPMDEIDAMRKFLIEHGTEEEIRTKAISFFDTNFLAYEAFLEDLKFQRPDINPEAFINIDE